MVTPIKRTSKKAFRKLLKGLSYSLRVVIAEQQKRHGTVKGDAAHG